MEYMQRPVWAVVKGQWGRGEEVVSKANNWQTTGLAERHRGPVANLGSVAHWDSHEPERQIGSQLR